MSLQKNIVSVVYRHAKTASGNTRRAQDFFFVAIETDEKGE
jgi:hypothetical protein